MWWLLAVTVLCQWQGSIAQVRYQPEQIHLSFGNDPTQMVATWSTWSDVGTPIVEYGQEKLDKIAIGFATKFVDGGPAKSTQFIQRVMMTDLKPGKRYLYHCGSKKGWSSLFFFYAMKNDTDWSPRLVVYGDLGNQNAVSLPRLQNDAQSGLYDAILHIGDFAYNLDENNAEMGDEFMRQIQPVAAYVPYMVSAGNHEQKYNFSNYKARFTMPSSPDNMFYSFNMGPVHFICVSTEFYYFLQYGFNQVQRQYDWVENDLKEANKPVNRVKRPWIILYGHKPMYCSNADKDDCTKYETMVRVGIPFLHWYGLEKLLYMYGVDLTLWAHEHSYERLWPLYNRKIYNGSSEKPYTNPGAPVHIITGSAGMYAGHDGFNKTRPEWSAVRYEDYGFTRMQIINRTHLHLDQVSMDKGGKVIDDMWLIKNKHGPYGAYADFKVWK